MGGNFPAFFQGNVLEIKGTKWLQYMAVLIAIILLLVVILINIHGELNGANSRFPAQ